MLIQRIALKIGCADVFLIESALERSLTINTIFVYVILNLLILLFSNLVYYEIGNNRYYGYFLSKYYIKYPKRSSVNKLTVTYFRN